uniref:MSP domain-containing protein n=1 Tax=Anopheles funestus TaxID=62324 RepID=A0A182RKK6_ANOFN
MDRTTTVSDALKRQRLLAAQAIRKANDISPQTVRHLREQCSPVSNSAASSATLYASPTNNASPSSMQQKSLNITELEEENTIHMATTPRKFTFEPKEITARSTMSQHPSDTNGKTKPSKFLSAGIEEILASSFADNIRSMGRSLRETAASVHATDFDGDQLANLSLPRTADMSKLSCDSLSSLPVGVRPETVTGISEQANNRDPWEMSQPAFESSWMKEKIHELSQMEEASFRSADHMASRLLEDEIAWEQENADIPSMNANRRQISPVKGSRKPQLKDHVDFSCFSGYLNQAGDISRRYDDNTANNDGSVCSVGHYFNKMSDDLNSMVGDNSPPQRRPLPLIDVTNDIESPRSPGKLFNESKVKQYGKENKETSLSVSCIAKAITSIDLEDSPHNFIHKLKQVQRTKSEQLSGLSTEERKIPLVAKSGSDLSASHATRAKQSRPSLYSTNTPEQYLRPPQNYQQCDTLSFSESMFDSSSTMPVLPHSKTSSPKASEFEATQTSWQNDETDRPAVTPVQAAKQKALVDTFRVSTATKLSEEYMDLPSIPRIRDTPTCQKNIFDERPIARANRKRRSNSTTREELTVEKRDDLALLTKFMQARSKSPSNRAELKAVSASSFDQHVRAKDSNISYRVTPKISHLRKAIPSEVALVRNDPRKSHLSPEPRAAVRSPYSSPKGETGRSSSPSEAYEEVADKYSLRVPGVPSRSASQCSGSTEWINRSEGTLPLKATHSELSWGSTKLRKSDKKTMQIKNTSNRKLLVKAVIVGPGFQLCGTEQSGLLTLQSQECRTITVDFCPTVIGAAIGALSFHPPNDLHIQRVVSLYGYGGEASIKIEGIQKGPSGPFLELGSARNLGRPLEKSFSLYNKGTLPAFARIGIDKKGLDQALLATAVYVQPQCTIIPPNSYAHIKVVFKPRRQEITKILQKQVDVLSITNLHILWGDEPTRHRIRKNIALVKQNNLIDPKMSALESICKPFTDEKELDGLDMFCEHVFDTIHELFLTFREYELVLTVDRALDETMLDLSMADGNTTLFKTMYASSEMGSSPKLAEDMILSGVPGSIGQSHAHGMVPSVAASASGGLVGMHRRDSGESWSVRPTALEFRPSTERTKQFVIKSNFYTAQYFELNSNYRQLFRLSPCEGHIRPGQEVVVNVSLQHLQPIGAANQQPSIFVVVYIENEKITIPVQIHYGN